MISRRALLGTVSVIGALASAARADTVPAPMPPTVANTGRALKHYAYIGAHRVHYRREGAGAPIVILPDFPNSSLSVEPLLGRLGRNATAIALDLPGTGESTALPSAQKGTAPTLDDYAKWMDEVLTGLGVRTVDLLAFETSAPVAIAFALMRPGRVRRLVVVEPTNLSAADRAEYLEKACPPIVPDFEGSHLTKQWGRLRDSYMFDPWFKRNMDARLYRDMAPAQRMYDEMLDLFRAGPNYWHGQHAAWREGDIALIGQVREATVLGSTKALGKLPGGLNSSVIEGPDDVLGIAAFFESAPTGRRLAAAPRPPAVQTIASTARRDYVQTSIGQILMRRIEGRKPGGVPLVIFHGGLWSSAGLESRLINYSSERPVLTFDAPGVGDSPGLGGEPTMVEIAKIIVEALDRLGLDAVDIMGGHSGAMLAIDVAILRPNGVRHAILDGVTMYGEAKLADMKKKYLIPLKITDDGAFLNWSWQFLRDIYLWSPWYEHRAGAARPDAAVLAPAAQHSGFVDFLKGGRTFSEYYRAALWFPTRERIGLIKVPTLLCCAENDSLRKETEEARALLPSAVFRITPANGKPGSKAATDAIYLRFLDDKPLDAPVT